MEWIKNAFADMICNMDWKQFIPSLIATFVGIFLPFFIQARIEKRKRQNAAKEMIEQIKTELKDTVKDIGRLEDDRRYIDPIKTPVWTGIQNTNEISLLAILRKKTKKAEKLKTLSGNKSEQEGTPNVDWYNKWRNLYTEQRTAGRAKEELKSVKNSINDLKDILCSQDEKETDSIQYVLSLLEKI